MKIEEARPIYQAKLEELIVELGLSRKLRGWKVVVKNNKQGRCIRYSQHISIPLWAFHVDTLGGDDAQFIKDGRMTQFIKDDRRNKFRYAKYYLCHEVAHLMVPMEQHSVKFMKALMKICPADAVYYEHDYKPTAARAAGIPTHEKYYSNLTQ